MKEFNDIKRIFRVIDRSLFHIDGSLDYDRVTEALTTLAIKVHNYTGDHDDLWYIGESGSCCLSDLIVGAYWHYSEWHGGQWSQGYAPLSALVRVFNPGMSGVEDENEGYIALNEMAENQTVKA